jgi:hypothetical protein
MAAHYRKQMGLGLDGKPRRYGRPKSMFRNPMSDKCRCGHVRGSHNCDQAWQRCGNTACIHEHCDCQKFEIANAPGEPRAQTTKKL